MFRRSTPAADVLDKGAPEQLDQVIHAMHVSGELASLSKPQVHTILRALCGADCLKGQDWLAEMLASFPTKQLDHLVHDMHVSGRLRDLSKQQVQSILYALHRSGHLSSTACNVSADRALSYDQDGLTTIHNCDFMRDPRFVEAYKRGITAAAADYSWHWRVHVGLWAAYHAHHLAGDFVECGVNRGFLSSAIMRYLDWNTLDKHFFLLDTFHGLEESCISEEEKKAGKSNDTYQYQECFEEVRQNFAEFRNTHLIRGTIPHTLPSVTANKVCYLHIDLNCAPPEIAAITYFWNKLVPGAVVLLDDYAYRGYEFQHRAMDEFAAGCGVRILSLPTGQGLILKPR